MTDFYIISGFLGAGKSFLLQRLLAEAGDSKIFVNEYATQGIDQELLKNASLWPVSLISDGCLCCDSSLNFMLLLRQQFALWQKIGQAPRRVIVESSGFFTPRHWLQNLLNDEFFRQNFKYKALITVLDVFHGFSNLAQFREAQEQVALADIIIINKEHGAPLDIIRQLEAKIRNYNPLAPCYLSADFLALKDKFALLDSIRSPISSPIKERVIEQNLARSQSTAISQNQSIAIAQSQGAAIAQGAALNAYREAYKGACNGADNAAYKGAYKGACNEAYNESYKDPSGPYSGHQYKLNSFCFKLSPSEAQNLSLSEIERFFTYLQREFGQDLLRLKALIYREEEASHYVFQAVQGLFYPYEILRGGQLNHKESYFILLSLRPLSQIERAFNGFFYRLGCEQPDREALLANPLIMPGF